MKSNCRTIYIASLILIGITSHAQQLTIPYQQFKLKNGLNVILHQDKALPQISVNVWYYVGSGNEKPGRTGFAHLFEHILFEGSKNVPEGKFDQWLEEIGSFNNGSTSNDRTNYYEELPSNGLDLALFLESDRMGYLLDVMSDSTVNGQRDVVKNERRQSYENEPYGKAYLELPALLYPKGHPYSWSTIGSMEDLTAARHEDVVDFFKTYYTPANASLCIAGDIEYDKTRQQVEKWFSDVPGRPAPTAAAIAPAKLEKQIVSVIEDDVQLPRLIITWLTPAHFHAGDGEMDVVGSILSQGKNSRLYKKLIYELQIAQDVTAAQSSQLLNSEFSLTIDAREGVELAQIEKIVWEELDLLKNNPPSERELARAVNKIESAVIFELESIGNKSDHLNSNYFYAGDADYENERIARYKAMAPDDITAAVKKYLDKNACVVMSIVPKGKTSLAVKQSAK